MEVQESTLLLTPKSISADQLLLHMHSFQPAEEVALWLTAKGACVAELLLCTLAHALFPASRGSHWLAEKGAQSMGNWESG